MAAIYDMLADAETMDDLTAVGVAVLSKGSLSEFQDTLRQKGIVFSADDMWTPDVINGATATVGGVLAALTDTITEGEASSMLHRLQLLRKCCPAVTSMVDTLLRKTTY